MVSRASFLGAAALMAAWRSAPLLMRSDGTGTGITITIIAAMPPAGRSSAGWWGSASAPRSRRAAGIITVIPVYYGAPPGITPRRPPITASAATRLLWLLNADWYTSAREHADELGLCRTVRSHLRLAALLSLPVAALAQSSQGQSPAARSAAPPPPVAAASPMAAHPAAGKNAQERVEQRIKELHAQLQHHTGAASAVGSIRPSDARKRPRHGPGFHAAGSAVSENERGPEHALL